MDLTILRSGLNWFKAPFLEPMTICFPFGLQHKHLKRYKMTEQKHTFCVKLLQQHY